MGRAVRNARGHTWSKVCLILGYLVWTTWWSDRGYLSVASYGCFSSLDYHELILNSPYLEVKCEALYGLWLYIWAIRLIRSSLTYHSLPQDIHQLTSQKLLWTLVTVLMCFQLLMKYEQNPYSFPTDFYSPFSFCLVLTSMFWNNLFPRLTVQGTVSVQRTSFSPKVAVFLSRMYTKYD